MEISEEAIRGFLRNSSGKIDFNKMKPESSLRKAGMDSMEIAGLMLEIEETYGIKVPDSDLDGLDSIKAIADYVRIRKTGA